MKRMNGKRVFFGAMTVGLGLTCGNASAGLESLGLLMGCLAAVALDQGWHRTEGKAYLGLALLNVGLFTLPALPLTGALNTAAGSLLFLQYLLRSAPTPEDMAATFAVGWVVGWGMEVSVFPTACSLALLAIFVLYRWDRSRRLARRVGRFQWVEYEGPQTSRNLTL